MAKIFIDPGHGGNDPGGVGNGLKEKDVVLKIAKKLRDILKNEYGVNVKMSRTTDKFLSLRERTNMANAWGADYFVSIHTNAGGGKGYEDFIYNGVSSNSKSAKYRNALHGEVSKRCRMTNRGKKKANFHVLRESKMPACLTECGFIDNANDAKLMKTSKWINDMARGHAEGIAKALGLKNDKGKEDDKNTGNKQQKPKTTTPKGKYPLPNGIVKQGAKGDKVRQIQTALTAVYFYPDKGAKNNGIDGMYGPKTADAVRRFQSVYVGQVDGIYGPNTKKALEKELKRRGLK